MKLVVVAVGKGAGVAGGGVRVFVSRIRGLGIIIARPLFSTSSTTLITLAIPDERPRKMLVWSDWYVGYLLPTPGNLSFHDTASSALRLLLPVCMSLQLGPTHFYFEQQWLTE